MYKIFARPLLFLFNPEKAHYITLTLLKYLLKMPLFKHVLSKSYSVKNKNLERNIWGITFKNPIGLAAGFDKNASFFNEMNALGFGFIEIGTLTPKPQKGNPKPRLFRLKKDKALINRMGFNNEGVDTALEKLKKRKKDIIIGGNIGKNKNTPNDKAEQDYLYCFEKLFDVVDYFVVNVSSPNTPNLRALQDKKPLSHLLKTLQFNNNNKKRPKPILLKIAPDLSEEQLDDIIDIVYETNIHGIIATNTTISRKNLKSAPDLNNQKGGLSGSPLNKKSTEIIRYIYQKTKGNIPIIGVGGVFSPQDAIEKLQAGASLIQIYTGFIYEGPSLIKKINNILAKKPSL